MATKFFRFIGGHGVFFKDLTLKKSEDNHACFNVLHDNYDWGEINDDSYYDCPLFDVTREYFPSILKSWFDKSDRENVRYSFYSSYFQGSSYSSDRLITAANMFDIFPGKALKKALPNEAEGLLASLRNQVKEDFSSFKELKESLLFSIGALTKKTLKERILERLDVLKPALDLNKSTYEDLEYIVGFAVKCRNFYVHGTEHKKLTPNLCFEFQSAFVDALEFIYAMSELVESGWHPKFKDHLSSHNKILRFEREISPVSSQLRAVLGGQSA